MAMDHDLTQIQTTIFVWVGLAICIFLTAIRGYVRWHHHKKFYADDYLAFNATLFLLITALHIHYMLPGLYESQRLLEGKPLQMSQSEFLVKVPLYLKLEISTMCFFWGALWSVKLSFLALIWRLLLGRQTYKNWWRAIMVYVIFTYIAEIFINIFACVPVPRRWSLNPNDSCDKDRSRIILQGICVAFDITSDLAIMILPLKALSALRLSKPRRLAVQAVFGLGVVIITVAALRCALTTFNNPEDFDHVLWIDWTWSEPWIAVLIVNIPPFKKDLADVWKKAISIQSYGSNKSSTYKTKNPTHSNVHMQLNHLESGLTKQSMDSDEWLNAPGLPTVITNSHPKPCYSPPIKRPTPPPVMSSVIPRRSPAAKSSKDFKDFKPFTKPNAPDEHGITVISDVEVTKTEEITEGLAPEDLQPDHPKHLGEAWG